MQLLFVENVDTKGNHIVDKNKCRTDYLGGSLYEKILGTNFSTNVLTC